MTGRERARGAKLAGAAPAAHRLDQLAGEIRDSQTTLDGDLIKLGRLLNEAQLLCPSKKEFGAWRSERTSVDRKTAYRAMESARLADAARKPADGTPCPINCAGRLDPDAMRLLMRDGTKADRDVAIARLERGEDVAADDARAIIDARKETKPVKKRRVSLRVDTEKNTREDLIAAGLDPKALERLVEVAAGLLQDAQPATLRAVA